MGMGCWETWYSHWKNDFLLVKWIKKIKYNLVDAVYNTITIVCLYLCSVLCYKMH